mmetsp:Transcript_52835/g.119332  ORF Transcript_52835/g.119332 Transcript_52835/m.119332 type:complete len:247 (-) Transcript_52835:63-803(-)
MALDLASLATTFEHDRVEAFRQAEVQVRRGEAKAEAMERSMQELRQRHQDELSALEAQERREVAVIKARMERKVRELEAQRQAMSQDREELRRQTEAMLKEARDIKSSKVDTWTEIRTQVESADRQTSKALSEAQESVNASTTGAEQSSQGIRLGLRMDLHRAWAPDPCWEEALQGVQSARRDADFCKVFDARSPLPFGATEWPFDGYGSYGKQSAPNAAAGFRQETTLKLLERSRLPPVLSGNRP